jgi:hypothetical protein
LESNRKLSTLFWNQIENYLLYFGIKSKIIYFLLELNQKLSTFLRLKSNEQCSFLKMKNDDSIDTIYNSGNKYYENKKLTKSFV